MTLTAIERIAERAISLSIDEIRRAPLGSFARPDDSYRGLYSKDRQYVLTSDQVNGLLDEALKNR